MPQFSVLFCELVHSIAAGPVLAGSTITVFCQKCSPFQVGPLDTIHEIQVARIQKDSGAKRPCIAVGAARLSTSIRDIDSIFGALASTAILLM